MSWTREDTKDVFKKVLGGLIAAAVIAIVYAVVEEMPWYYSALLGLGLLALVFLLIWRMGALRKPAPGPSVPTFRHPKKATEAELTQAPSTPPAPMVQPSDEPRQKDSDEKVLKKLAKAEQKRRKKEAKAQKKSED